MACAYTAFAQQSSASNNVVAMKVRTYVNHACGVVCAGANVHGVVLLHGCCANLVHASCMCAYVQCCCMVAVLGNVSKCKQLVANATQVQMVDVAPRLR
eukprot:13860352-Alexandrium_andersonii.AAC.1